MENYRREVLRVSTRNKLLTVNSSTVDERSSVELVASRGRVQVSKICSVKSCSPGHTNSVETMTKPSDQQLQSCY